MPKSDAEITTQMEEFCQRVLQGAKPKILNRDEMEAQASLKGKYAQGYRVAQAQHGLRTYTVTFNPTTERLEVEYH
ncbi:MAG: hypothetical protein HYY02_13665 [Chloroflexi bacterium]|nr:hypothetical protein [Chloroflexota bacterium]